jgi:hypothetical protein
MQVAHDQRASWWEIRLPSQGRLCRTDLLHVTSNAYPQYQSLLGRISLCPGPANLEKLSGQGGRFFDRKIA